jgi:hypothetical protein
MIRFPLVVFSYNRPEYLEKLFISLSICKNIKNRKIFFFCDGPKNSNDKININKIRKLLKKYNFLNFSKIIFNEKNIGLYENIKKGCNYVFKRHISAIILEDDLILHEKSLIFFDDYLKKFKNDKSIGSISAFSYINIINKKLFFYKLKRHSSWGWGTWRHKWFEFNKFNLSDVDLKNVNLNLIGYDFPLLVWAKKNLFINSWAVDFNVFCLIKNYLSIQPSQSLVINNGENTSGTNYFNFFHLKKLKKNEFFNNKITVFDIKKNHFKKYKYFDLIVQNFHKKSIRLYFFKILQDAQLNFSFLYTKLFKISNNRR